MHTIFIDGAKFSDFEGFMEYMQGVLLDNSYNHKLEGLDALADVLEGGFGVYGLKDEVRVKWKEYKKSKQDLGEVETYKYLSENLESCHPTNKEEVKEMIMFAQTDNRYTLFYFILDVFFEAKNVKTIELF